MALVKVCHLIDDHSVSAKTLRPKPSRIYALFSTQGVENIKAKHEASLFDKGANRDKHASTFFLFWMSLQV